MGNQNTGDGKFVVVQNGKRVSGLKETQAEANTEAEKQRKLTETQQTPAPPVQVKQHLCG